MDYGKLVSKYIEESGLSLGEIAEKMKELGVKADRSYLSKLRNNPKYPASEEVNKALAKVTGGDEDALVFAAFMEKAPDVAKRYFSKISDLDEYLKKFANVTCDNNLKELLDVIDADEKIELFKIIAEDAMKQGKNINSFLVKESNVPYSINSKKENISYSTNDVKVIPLFSQLTAVQSISTDCHKERTCVEPSVLKGKDGFALKVSDDSMAGDRIYNGDIVVIVKQPDVTPSDIAVVRINNGEATLSRVKKQGDLCILSPSNPAMEPILVPINEIEIIGKVVEVKFQLP
ncbi:S24 family peptidase [Paenibacillus dendritiformis]|uniref:S24 family peptidase n=1 Tax=Paenibacillus dendritiformis TaxID=130049 RepID=UPI0015EC9292|nr:S24 family peptidase [Paenibacillus dendritiformis]